LTRPLIITVVLVGLAITVALLGLIQVGRDVYGSVPIGQSIAFSSFAICLIVAAFECRSETESILTPATFDSRQMNWVALGEFVVAVMTTQLNMFNRMLGTVPIDMQQFGWALLPAVSLLILWELGKFLARRGSERLTVGAHRP